MNLVFLRVHGECCAFCNPVALADFEGECISVHIEGAPQKRVNICISCVHALSSARDHATFTIEIEPEVASMLWGRRDR